MVMMKMIAAASAELTELRFFGISMMLSYSGRPPSGRSSQKQYLTLHVVILNYTPCMAASWTSDMLQWSHIQPVLIGQMHQRLQEESVIF